MKKITLILVAICMVLCLAFAVSCSNNQADTNTDTSSNTSTDTNTTTDTGATETTDTESDMTTDTESDVTTDEVVDEYRVYVVDKDGNPIKLALVTFCNYVGETQVCETGFTNVNGYVVIPSAEYHVSGVTPTSGNYASQTGLEIHFEEGSKTITVTLEDAAE